ncbi:glycoside hydrolase family 15 protein [Myxococcus sp. CA051A]|uniref:glycoside hydrolase family 15 protein n=1 Tax=unclassified Myxococcus TaxID=2648731 RepID=UPI00157A2B68|nr:MULTISPECIES: glycoside hydrolase family 15 protein [unclassified Myxococcus]NTX10476.1 glycoside hydrolase family 15 protein [Myxococcus sp. CA056]NTX38112.1 glycoside hydrolase family 15 protein [Myxococcus sp. CA033]NTX51155.1 glycoside hydrolase family 15 protein [Myxococcus sp. CA039A]NTX63265.1 glycoside hydrolase family 15 protein [Myxococcus sp. CA051A]
MQGGRHSVAGGSVPIEDHGVIGDLRTVALIGNEGTIDWMCYPHFDSPSVFAALLDPEKGGHWRLHPQPDGVMCKQFYWPDTNVLVTRFYTPDGVGELIDFMPMGRDDEKDVREVLRRVRVVRGEMAFEMECFPAFNYARDTHTTHLIAGGAAFESEKLQLTLASSVPMRRAERGVTASFVLRENESAVFTLREGMRVSCEELVHSHDSAEKVFRATVEYWRHWLSGCQYTGRWRETVQRSALALKLMTFAPTGAIVAAPTCSLPESPGGTRNWDYRYCWLRDAAFTVYAFLRIGFKKEAAAFMRWVEARCAEQGDGPLPLMFSLDGSRVPDEVELPHLAGYGGAKPVRIGNGAADQLQLDIYGELMDSVYLFNKYAAPISYDFWRHLRRLVDWVCEHWNQPDEGIWEVRGGRRHFVYSKLMCWVAVDRAIRLADKRSFPADRPRWLATRDAIFEDIMARGWSEERGSFIQAYGKDTLDAANLLMPLVFFLSPVDPRMISTLDHMRQPPSKGGLTSDGLVFRYDVEATLDGIAGSEGTFNLCSFWLVEAMTRANPVRPDLLEEARLTFERMLGYANHVGLYAEQTGMSGESLGNFPQALTHLSLISAAYNLDRTLGRKD